MKKIAFILTALCLHTATYAARPITEPFGRLEDVTSLTMILTPNDFPNSRNLAEAQLAEVGCTYRITDPNLIAEVIKNLQPARFGGDVQPVRLRHAIYLNLKGASEPTGAKYLLAEGQSPTETIGSVDAPSIRSEAINFTTKPEAPELLRVWARTHISLISFVPPRSDPSNPCTFVP